MADKEVRIYTTPTCPWCRKVKEYLTEKNIPFTDFDVSQDREKLEEMVNLTGQRGVPVIAVGDEVIVGFNQSRIDQALMSKAA